MKNCVVPAGADPREYGFNYGLGWGVSPKPPIYHEGMKLADRLRKIAAEASSKAWSMDEALRNVRLAETPREKARALSALEAEIAKHQTIKVPA